MSSVYPLARFPRGVFPHRFYNEAIAAVAVTFLGCTIRPYFGVGRWQLLKLVFSGKPLQEGGGRHGVCCAKGRHLSLSVLSSSVSDLAGIAAQYSKGLYAVDA